MLRSPAPGDWLSWRRTVDSWGYSPLDRVTRDNVGDLQMVWSRALHDGAQQGTPIAYGGVLYLPNPNDVTQALDAETGDLIWEYRREIPDDIARYVGGLNTVNRKRRHLGPVDHRHRQRRLRLRPRYADGRARLGDADRRPEEGAGAALVWPDHRRGQGDLGAKLPAGARAGGLLHRRPRRRHRQRDLAARSDSRTR